MIDIESRQEKPPQRRHVIVVGAGIVGASIAWHLAARHGDQVRVTVVASKLGGTATPNSFAWVNANRGNPRVYYDLRHRSMARWRQMAGEVPGLSDLVQWTGSIQWDQPPDALARFVEQHSSWGYNVARVDAAEIARSEPQLAPAAWPSWGWGVRAADEGAVEPELAAGMLLKDAQRLAQIRVETDKTVDRLILGDNGAVKGVVAQPGDIHMAADHVVLAAGVGTSAICAATTGLLPGALPITGRSGLLVHSKPVSQRLLNSIVLSQGLHMRQTTEGRIVTGADFGGGRLADGATPDEICKASEDLLAEASCLFLPAAFPPPTEKLEFEFYTVGERPQPRDGLPILGAVPGRPGLTLAVMHSGVTLAAIVGELLADQAATGATDPALAAFSLSRFGV